MLAHEFLAAVNEIGEFSTIGITRTGMFGNENTIKHTVQKQRRLKRIRRTRIVGKNVYYEITDGGRRILKWFDENGCRMSWCSCHRNENKNDETEQ